MPDRAGGKEGDEEECNCFGAGFEGECCRTCDDVKAAYRRKGWRLDASAVPSVRAELRLKERNVLIAAEMILVCGGGGGVVETLFRRALCVQQEACI